MWRALEGLAAPRPAGAASSSSSLQNGGLLSDWNQYQSESMGGGSGGDVEGGGFVDGIFASTVEGASKGVNGLLSAVGGGAGAAGGLHRSLSSSLSGESGILGMPSQQQWTHFACLLGAGLVFLSLALFVFLPMIIFAPAKFATSFTLGCLLCTGASMALRGWRAGLLGLMNRDRLPFTGLYLGSTMATLYAALAMHSYLLCLACSVAQVGAMLYFLASYVPGGARGVRFVVGSCGKGAWALFRSIFSK